MAAGVSVDDIRNKNRILLVDAHLEKKKRLDVRAKQKMAQGRQKKLDEKLAKAGGVKVLMPEVFVSNYNKQ